MKMRSKHVITFIVIALKLHRNRLHCPIENPSIEDILLHALTSHTLVTKSLFFIVLSVVSFNILTSVLCQVKVCAIIWRQAVVDVRVFDVFTFLIT